MNDNSFSDNAGNSNTGGSTVFTATLNGLAQLVGADIDGEAAGDFFGRSVAMNAVGDRLIVGAIGNDNASGGDAGHARVFQYINNAWTQLDRISMEN